MRHSLTHVKHGATRSTAQCARKHLRARSTLALQQTWRQERVGVFAPRRPSASVTLFWTSPTLPAVLSGGDVRGRSSLCPRLLHRLFRHLPLLPCGLFRVSVEEDDLLSALLRMFVGLKRTWDVAPAERVQGRSSSPTGVWPSR